MTYDKRPAGFIQVDADGRVRGIRLEGLKNFFQCGEDPANWVGKRLDEIPIARELSLNSLEKPLPSEGETASRQIDGLEAFVFTLGKGRGKKREKIILLIERDGLHHRWDTSVILQILSSEAALAGSLALDFENMLSIIIRNTKSLKSKIDPSQPLWEEIQSLDTAALSTGQLLDKLRDFRVTDLNEADLLDLNDAVREVISFMRRFFDRRVGISLELSPNLFPIRANPVEIRRMLLNLLMNSSEAMPHGGSLQIRTGCLSSQAAGEIGVKHCPKGAVWMAVKDSGLGMPPEVREKAFQPFFTTKIESHHLGLGLNTVERIVKRHSGILQIESQMGRGSTFTAYFPAVRRKFKDGDSKSQKGKRNRGVILLADREPLVRLMARRLLEAAGYRVIEACDHQETVELYHEHQHEVDLTILDVISADPTDLSVLERILEIDRNARVLLSSGNLSENELEGALSAGAAGFIQKPFRMKFLLSKIQSIRSEASEALPEGV